MAYHRKAFEEVFPHLFVTVRKNTYWGVFRCKNLPFFIQTKIRKHLSCKHIFFNIFQMMFLHFLGYLWKSLRFNKNKQIYFHWKNYCYIAAIWEKYIIYIFQKSYKCTYNFFFINTNYPFIWKNVSGLIWLLYRRNHCEIIHKNTYYI